MIPNNLSPTYKNVKTFLLQSDIKFLNYKLKHLRIKKLFSLNLSDHLQNFGIKFLFHILPTKSLLNNRRIIVLENLNCIFCKIHLEDFKHLFYYCSFFQTFMNDFFKDYMPLIRNKELIFVDIDIHFFSLSCNLQKYYLIIMYSWWRYRCNLLFSDFSSNLYYLCNYYLQKEYMLDCHTFGLDWISKYWP